MMFVASDKGRKLPTRAKKKKKTPRSRSIVKT
jgi:hypothetical protein